MNEKEFEIHDVDPLDLFGVNEKKLTIIKSYFPKRKISARGNQLKVLGKTDEISEVEEKLMLLIEHLKKYKQLTENNIDRILSSESENDLLLHENEVLVFGNNGLVVKPRTKNQRELVKKMSDNDMVFAIGPAGTGKTYTAVALAVRALKNKAVRRIILTRPAVEAGEHLGFLPGDLKEKLDPYLQPLYDALRDMIPAERLNDMIENGIIQIAPLAFMRGRTLDNAFVILDEAQNTTKSQFKMFLTRMGKSAKFIITGDLSQIDLPKSQQSGLKQALDILKDVKGIGVVRFDEQDVIRHHLVKHIISAYKKAEE